MFADVSEQTMNDEDDDDDCGFFTTHLSHIIYAMLYPRTIIILLCVCKCVSVFEINKRITADYFVARSR